MASPQELGTNRAFADALANNPALAAAIAGGQGQTGAGVALHLPSQCASYAAVLTTSTVTHTLYDGEQLDGD